MEQEKYNRQQNKLWDLISETIGTNLSKQKKQPTILLGTTHHTLENKNEHHREQKHTPEKKDSVELIFYRNEQILQNKQTSHCTLQTTNSIPEDKQNSPENKSLCEINFRNERNKSLRIKKQLTIH